MPGIKWATKSELAFMTTKLDSFSAIHADGKARVKNHKKDLFLKDVYEEFNQHYPGRISSMDLPRVGMGGSEAGRKEVMLERFKNWFQNALRNPARSDSGSRRILDLSTNGQGGRKRAEQPIYTYYRLYKDELQREIELDYARQNETITQVAHRNRFLTEKLKNASDVVKEAVQKERLLAGSTLQKEIKWADEDEISEKEIQRRNAALALNEEISAAVRTMDKATDVINQMTGWNATVVLGGPDPKRAGGIHVIAVHKGKTKSENDEDSQSFQEYFYGWQQLMDSFSDFCEASFTKEERDRVSLSNVFRQGDTAEASHKSESTEGSSPDFSVTSGTGLSSDTMSPDRPDRQCHQNTVMPPVTKPGEHVNDHDHVSDHGHASVSSNPEHVGSIQTNSEPEQPNVFHHSPLPRLACLSPKDTATPATVNDNRHDPSIDPHLLSPSQRHGILQAAQAIEKAGKSPTKTPRPETYYLPPGPIGSPIFSSPLSSPQPNPPKRQPLGEVRNGTRRSGRQPGLQKGDEYKNLPSSGHWTVDAVKYLTVAFEDHPLGGELIEKFKVYEKHMGYPTNAARNKLQSNAQPAAVTSWLHGVRDLYKVPESVYPINTFITELFEWYHSLQPITRQRAWDLASSFQPPYTLMPRYPQEWINLHKAGPNGIFIFIMALSWLPRGATRYEDKVLADLLIKDFVWVLGTMCGLDKSLKNPAGKCQTAVVNAEGAGKENRKRKLSEIAAHSAATRKKSKKQ